MPQKSLLAAYYFIHKEDFPAYSRNCKNIDRVVPCADFPALGEVSVKRVIHTLILTKMVIMTGCGDVFRDVPVSLDGSWLLFRNYDIPELSYIYPEDGEEGVELNRSVVVAFTKEMDFNRDESGIITLTCEETGVTVPGEVLTSGNRAVVFRPVNPLDEMSSYRVTVNRNLADFDGNLIPIAGMNWRFGTGAYMDTEHPYVTFRRPGENSAGIPLDTVISAEFSEAVNPAVIIGDNVMLRNGLLDVSAAVEYDKDQCGITIKPDYPLSRDTMYTVVLMNMEDLAGNCAGGAITWDFTTEEGPPVPEITTRYPGSGDSNVGVDDFIIVAFTRDMNFSAMDGTFELEDIYGNVVEGFTRPYGNRMLIFTPSRRLNFNRLYTVRITRDFADLDGQTLPVSGHTWSFTTSRNRDMAPPEIRGRFPEDRATVKAENALVRIYFNEQIDPFTVNGTTVIVREEGFDLPGSYHYSVDDRMVSFEPHHGFRDNTPYTVDVSGITDMSGNIMEGGSSWGFNTAVREEPGVTEYQLVEPEETDPGRYSFHDPPRPLADNFGNLLTNGVDFVYGEPLTGDYNIVDTGIHGPLDTVNGRYFRIVHNGASILDLGLTPVAWDLSTTASPPGDSFYVDPVRGEFILPRPSYWSRMDSEENMGAHADICEGKPFISKTVDKSEDVVNGRISDVADIFENGKFGSAYTQRSYSSSNIKTHSANTERKYEIIQDIKEYKDFCHGSISLWINSKIINIRPMGTETSIEGHWFFKFDNNLKFHLYYNTDGYLWGEILINGMSILKERIDFVIGEWHHIYIVWGDLSDNSTIKLYFDNQEVIRSSYSLPDEMDSIKDVTIGIKSITNATGSLICHQGICGFLNASITLYHRTDNIKLFNHVCSEYPNWEYMSGYGNEKAVHPVFIESEYQPVLIKNDENDEIIKGVGFFIIE